jgi:poly(A) polymerase Pap1
LRVHNCHTHIFTNRIVPAEFLPLGLVRVLSRRRVSRQVAKLLNWLNPFSDSDLFDRYAAFVEIGASKSQPDIFELLRGCLKCIELGAAKA